MHNVERARGFTLIELMVVIAVMVLLMSMVLLQNRSGQSGLEATNLAYEVALFIREAQSYGVAVREEDIGAGQFDLGYGVYLDEDTPEKLVLFKDTNKDGDFTGVDITLKELILKDGYDVAMFSGVTSGGNEVLSSSGSLDTMTISFIRPNPDAQIMGEPSGATYSIAHIYLRAPSGFQKRISTYVTGQIAIENY